MTYPVTVMLVSCSHRNSHRHQDNQSCGVSIKPILDLHSCHVVILTKVVVMEIFVTKDTIIRVVIIVDKPAASPPAVQDVPS